MSVKKYKVYKDSGEYWLGEIPESWTNIRLRLISTIIKGKKPKKDYDKFEEGLYPYLSMEFLRGKSENPTYANPQEGNLLVVEEGDILILWDGSNAGEIVQAKAGVLSSTMAKIELKSDLFNSSFLNYYLQRAQQHIKNHNIGMGIPHVNGKILRDLSLLIPPLSEQHQIAAFLDHKTALIDEIIAKKERLIQVLQAKRQATINEVVTGKKVWNAASQTWEAPAKVKNSGVEWLGEIPEEWEVVKLRRIGEFSKGKGITKDKISAQGHQCIRCGELYTTYDRIFYNSKSCISDEIIQETVLGQKGDVFFAGDGETMLDIGKAVVYNGDEPIYVGGGINILTPNLNKVSSAFISYALNSSYSISQKSIDGRGDIIVHIYSKQLKEHFIVLPNIEQQKLIEILLDKLDETTNFTVSKIKTQIQSLKSYRQSLISEAVTGKIDVRDFFIE